MNFQSITGRINLLLILLFLHHTSTAQHSELIDSSQIQVFADSGKSYFIPDVKHRDMNWTRGSSKYFTIQMGFVPIIDYNLNIQDEKSEQQVGKQESRFDIRSARVSARGNIKFKNPWTYFVSLEYKGFDRTEDDTKFGLTDFKISIPLQKNFVLSIGKIKETFCYEMVGDAANLPHMERLLNPFFKSRSTGAMLNHSMLKDRMTVAAGWYNDWPSGGNGINTITGRITALPVWKDDGKQFIHWGVSFRYVPATDNKIRLKGKNESNISSNYVDTKDFEAMHQFNLGFEQLLNYKNVSFLMEYIHNWSESTLNTAEFEGYYITGSYIFTGESRPYDKKAAYARRIKPSAKHGAWELFARIGKVDLDSKDIHGGINKRFTTGINWWATQYWKVGVCYGLSNLDKNEINGKTQTIQTRLQWVF